MTEIQSSSFTSGWNLPGSQIHLAKMILFKSNATWYNIFSDNQGSFFTFSPGCVKSFRPCNGKIPFCTEERYHHKDGSTVWFICTGKVIEWDESGNPKRMVGVDITRRKHAQLTILKNEAHFQKSSIKPPWQWP